MDHDARSDSGSDDRRDSDSDNEDNFGAHRAVRADRIAFHEFLALVAGNRFRHDRAPQDNQALVDHLRAGSSITSDLVYRAFLACPRGDFVPRRHQHEAYIDAPIKVEDMGFNISAPHMHATMIEALKIAPGDRVLDVGCGCGIVAACAAFLVGIGGEVVALDVRPAAMELCRGNVQRLRRSSTQYAERACEVVWEEHNVFLPAARHVGRYHKVHVGGNCPPARLRRLHELLRPEGGVLVAPSGTDLLLITRRGNHVEQRVISQVRFSELEVPTDAEIVLAAMQQEVAARAVVTVPPPTPLSAALPDLGPSAAGAKAAPRQPSAPAPAGTRSDTDDVAAADVAAVGCDDAAMVALGPTDCFLVGRGWRLAAHRAVLQARCDLFRAQCASGMRDAQCAECGAPEGLSQAVARALLSWAYSDALPPGLDASQVVELVRAATYYGAPRLQALCEQRLAAEFLAHPAPTPAKTPSAPPAASPRTPRAPRHGATTAAATAAVVTADDDGAAGGAGPVAADDEDDSSMVDAAADDDDDVATSGDDVDDDGGEMEEGWHAVRAHRAAARGRGRAPSDSGATATSTTTATASASSSTSSSPSTSSDGGALGGAPAAGGGKREKAAGAGRAATAAAAGGVGEGGGSELPDSAMQLLALADECGLPQLRAAALAYAAAHYKEVAATPSYRTLPRHLVDAVAAELSAHLARFTDLLHHLASNPVQQQPAPFSRFW